VTQADREAIYFGKGMNERNEIESLNNLLNGVKTFADIGASLGQYTYFAGNIISRGHIIAVEADPVWYPKLAGNVAQWQKDSDNKIEAIHAAVTDMDGPMTFYSNGEISGAGFVSKGVEFDNPTMKWSATTVTGITLDTLLLSHNPDFIKIDIEGFEYRALVGAKRILANAHCRFLIEVHPWGDPTIGKTPGDVFQIMYDNGYDFRRHHRHFLFAPASNKGLAYAKLKAIKFVMANPTLKKLLKAMILKMYPSPR
jgi:FkbM family methyltransferase